MSWECRWNRRHDKCEIGGVLPPRTSQALLCHWTQYMLFLFLRSLFSQVITHFFFSSFRSPLYHHLLPRPPQPKQILESTFHHITLFILLHMNLPHFLCIAYFLSCTLGFKLLSGKGCPFCSLLYLQCQKEGMASARYSIIGTMDYTLEIFTSPEKCHLHGTSAQSRLLKTTEIQDLGER